MRSTRRATYSPTRSACYARFKTVQSTTPLINVQSRDHCCAHACRPRSEQGEDRPPSPKVGGGRLWCAAHPHCWGQQARTAVTETSTKQSSHRQDSPSAPRALWYGHQRALLHTANSSGLTAKTNGPPPSLPIQQMRDVGRVSEFQVGREVRTSGGRGGSPRVTNGWVGPEDRGPPLTSLQRQAQRHRHAKAHSSAYTRVVVLYMHVHTCAGTGCIPGAATAKHHAGKPKIYRRLRGSLEGRGDRGRLGNGASSEGAPLQAATDTTDNSTCTSTKKCPQHRTIFGLCMPPALDGAEASSPCLWETTRREKEESTRSRARASRGT